MFTSSQVKRSIVINRRKTSISLEQDFWDGFVQMAKAKKYALGELAAIMGKNRKGGLSSAIRVAVYRYACSLVDVTKLTPVD